jgi:hypothetical protein
MTPREVENFWKRVTVRADGCWDWNGALTHKGYAALRYEGNTRVAHRFSYRLLVGPIPDGLQLDHLCRNRSCTNLGHLEPVDNWENQRRSPLTLGGRAIRSQTCPQGHSCEAERKSDGSRWCRTCHNANARARWPRRRVA